MSASQMSSKLELRISCDGLLGSDALSAANPLVIVQMKDKVGKFYEVKIVRLLQLFI